MGSDNVKSCVASYLKLHPSHVELCQTTVSDEKFCGLTFASWACFFSCLHRLCYTTKTCLHPQILHLVVICLHNRQEMFVVPVQSLFLFSLFLFQSPTLAWSSISASDSSSQRSKSGAKNRGFFSCSVSRSHQRSSCFLILMSTRRWVDLWLIWKRC